MLTVFNRKEVAATYDMAEQSRVRRILAENHIDYRVKVINRKSPSAFSDTRARTGTFGEKPELFYEYFIYVHKRDAEEAQLVLRKP